MSRPLVRIIDTATGDIVDREMNDAEYEQHLIDVAAFVTPTPALEG